jgi:hypothetical protein
MANKYIGTKVTDYLYCRGCDTKSLLKKFLWFALMIVSGIFFLLFAIFIMPIQKFFNRNEPKIMNVYDILINKLVNIILYREDSLYVARQVVAEFLKSKRHIILDFDKIHYITSDGADSFFKIILYSLGKSYLKRLTFKNTNEQIRTELEAACDSRLRRLYDDETEKT